MKTASFAVLLLFFVCGAALAAEEKEVDLQRNENGAAIIQKDVYMDIPKDRKILKVASNVIKAEDVSKFTDRRVTELEQRMGIMDSRISDLEKRLTELENKQGDGSAGDRSAP